MKKKKNVAPAFKTISTLSVFAGLCTLPVAVQAQTTQQSATTDNAAASKVATRQANNNSAKSSNGNTLIVTGESLPSLYLPQTLSDPKFTAPLADTTRTVTIISGKVILEQQATTPSDALKNSSGAGAFYSGETGSTNMSDSIMFGGLDTSNHLFSDCIHAHACTICYHFNSSSIF